MTDKRATAIIEVPNAVDDFPETDHARFRSPSRRAFEKLVANTKARVGGIIVLGAIIVALLAPTISPYDPIDTNFPGRLEPPNRQHLMGTDDLGRDILSRVIFGARLSLSVGVVAISVAIVLGVPLGLIAGYSGSWVDNSIMRFIDFLLAFPGFLLAIVIAGTLGPSLRNALLAVGVIMVPTFARVIRGSTLSVKESTYVLAARSLGATPRHIILRHVLPNVISPIIVLASLTIGTAIIATASLSFIGLGAQPPTPEWGAMLSAGRDYLRQEWWISAFPGITITIVVLGINLLGDGLRDALDPRFSTS